jgi:hypothetical protein
MTHCGRVGSRWTLPPRWPILPSRDPAPPCRARRSDPPGAHCELQCEEHCGWITAPMRPVSFGLASPPSRAARTLQTGSITSSADAPSSAVSLATDLPEASRIPKTHRYTIRGATMSRSRQGSPEGPGSSPHRIANPSAAQGHRCRKHSSARHLRAQARNAPDAAPNGHSDHPTSAAGAISLWGQDSKIVLQRACRGGHADTAS